MAARKFLYIIRMARVIQIGVLLMNSPSRLVLFWSDLTSHGELLLPVRPAFGDGRAASGHWQGW